VGIYLPGELDFDLLNGWVQSLLASSGQNIYRMKGILNVKGEEDRFVFQGVHMVSMLYVRIKKGFMILTFIYRCLMDNKIEHGDQMRIKPTD
jgi:G3E family GTPase